MEEQAKPGHSVSLATRRKISKAMKGRSNFKGKHHTSDTKDQLSKIRGHEDRIKGRRWRVDKQTGEESRVYNRGSSDRYYWGRSIGEASDQQGVLNQYAQKIANSIKQYMHVDVAATQDKETGNITFTINHGHMVNQPGEFVANPQNLSKAIDPFFREFRQKGWTFTQPANGSFTIGIPNLHEAAMSTEYSSGINQFFTTIHNNTTKDCSIFSFTLTEGGKWEAQAISGHIPSKLTETAYMSYLSPSDIVNWITSDYPDHVIGEVFQSAIDAREYLSESDVYESLEDIIARHTTPIELRESFIISAVDKTTHNFSLIKCTNSSTWITECLAGSPLDTPTFPSTLTESQVFNRIKHLHPTHVLSGHISEQRAIDFLKLSLTNQLLTEHSGNSPIFFYVLINTKATFFLAEVALKPDSFWRTIPLSGKTPPDWTSATNDADLSKAQVQKSIKAKYPSAEFFTNHQDAYRTLRNLALPKKQVSESTSAPLLTKLQAINLMESINELSTKFLAKYKDAASKDASKADKKQDFKRGDKRFKGIIQATNKQFKNETK